MKFDDEICKGISCPECSFNKGEDGCLLAKRLDEIEIIPEPCEDAVSRNAIIQKLNTMDRYVSEELRLCDTDKKFPKNEVFIVDDVYEEIVENLPSAQPEIIRCKDCKHWDGVDTCDVIDAPVWDNDFCSMAERRSDE